jgi:hypothetical protein
MARFFFHVTNGSTFKDAEGENCSSLEAARISSIFGNAGSAVVVVERRVREWRGALLAKLAEAGAR